MSENSEFTAMTVNERLSHFGLFDAFDSAVAARELQAVIDVLVRAKLTPAEALDTATAVLNNPNRFGLR